ncbi:unnamed protein product [Brassica oleracea var. botrytis]
MQHHSEMPASMKQPLCPKPRRVCPPLPHLLNPISCSLRSSNCQRGSEARSGVLSIIDKVQPMEGGTTETVWYAGSPPKRTGNPLVHDLHFIHTLDLLPDFSSTKA